jgi:hypothetical protein
MRGDRAVKTAPNNLAILHQHCADRHLAQGRTFGGQGQGLAHKVLILAAINDQGVAHA